MSPRQTNQTDEIEIRSRLIATMDALVMLLDKHQVTSWSDTLKQYRVGIKAKDPGVTMNFAAHNRSSFAGILDLVICEENTHAITKEQEAEVDVEMSALRSAMICDVNALEHLAYNVQDADGGFLCPVCGSAHDFDGMAFDKHGGVIGTVICCCCLYEPGFDDNPRASAKAQHTVTHSILFYREEWISKGKPWRGQKNLRPAKWSADAQLAKLFECAPYLPRD